MKLDLKKMYIVYKPGKHSVKADIFTGRPTNITNLKNQFIGGLQPERIYGIYTTRIEAERITQKLLKGKQTNKKKPGVKPEKGYALFSNAVMAEDKYDVTTPPKAIYRTKKEAEKEVQRIRKREGRDPQIRILSYDPRKRKR